MASELESDLRDTVDWVRSGLLISVQGKLSWFHLTALWQQLELASEHESDLRDTVDWGRKSLLAFNAGKTHWSNNTGSIEGKKDRSVLGEKSSFMLGLTFSSKLDWGSCIISIAKTASTKTGALNLFYEVSFSLGCFLSL